MRVLYPARLHRGAPTGVWIIDPAIAYNLTADASIVSRCLHKGPELPNSHFSFANCIGPFDCNVDGGSLA